MNLVYHRSETVLMRSNQTLCAVRIDGVEMSTKRQLVIVALAFAGLAAPGSVTAQQLRQSQAVPPKQQQSKTYPRFREQKSGPMYQRGHPWCEFLLKQFNPSNFDYGQWMEEQRQTFLDASARNPYFKYSSGVTIALLVLMAASVKRWVDHRRGLWITAEMTGGYITNFDCFARCESCSGNRDR